MTRRNLSEQWFLQYREKRGGKQRATQIDKRTTNDSITKRPSIWSRFACYEIPFSHDVPTMFKVRGGSPSCKARFEKKFPGSEYWSCWSAKGSGHPLKIDSFQIVTVHGTFKSLGPLPTEQVNHIIHMVLRKSKIILNPRRNPIYEGSSSLNVILIM